MNPQRNIGLHYDVTVARVVDGDTVIVTYGYRDYRIRLYAIDAPESEQAYGKKSTQILETMLDNNISLEVIEIDQYKRIIGLLYPYQGNPRNSYNLRMVREGHAFWSKIYGGEEYGFNYAARYARENKLGVWNKTKFHRVKPWEYRKKPKKQSFRRFLKSTYQKIILFCRQIR